MTSSRTAIVIPGIMGSVLYYGRTRNEANEIWSENLLANYRRLLSNPTVLRWNDVPAQAELLEAVYTSRLLKLPKVHLWKNLLRFLANHQEFGSNGHTLKLGYDWRQSLLVSAATIGSRVKEHIAWLSRSENISEQSVRLVFFTHSMGGLVVRIALSLGAIDPSNIDRIIHIGSPLRGAPQAFSAAYRRGSLPLLQGLVNLIQWRNKDAFFSHLLETFRTFPSVFQLMPPRGYPFLYYSISRRESPLAEAYIPQALQKLANQAHNELAKAQELLITKNLKVFTICTKVHSQKETELEYRVQPQPAPAEGYIIEETIGKTDRGDGTVPFESAQGIQGFEETKPILNVDHLDLCNSQQVVALLPTILG
jgi:hypothetical protein